MGILGVSYEPGLHEAIRFITNLLMPIWGKLIEFLFYGLHPGGMLRWYSATLHSIPGISLGDHAKTFTFWTRKLMSLIRPQQGLVLFTLVVVNKNSMRL
ncbi:hypothetical protein BHE74_00048701 [Ensete ventricosum]|nr:hypothetical protein BHE74_00048701 [Ensete ventricosum]